MTPSDLVVANHRDSAHSCRGEIVHIGSMNGEVVNVLLRLDDGGYRHFDLDDYEISPAN